jgi:hypothetical protein
VSEGPSLADAPLLDLLRAASHSQRLSGVALHGSHQFYRWRLAKCVSEYTLFCIMATKDPSTWVAITLGPLISELVATLLSAP